MNKIIIVITTIILLSIEINLLFQNKSLKAEITSKNDYLENLTLQNSVLKPQFFLNINNVGKNINDIEVKDTLNNKCLLSEIFDSISDTILICRYSEFYCQQCVNHAMNIILNNKDQFDMSKIVFLADNGSKRATKVQIKEYGLEKYNVYNCTELNIPAEQIKAPYYMIVDKNLHVLSVYLPNKSTHGTDFDFKNLKYMYDSLIQK